MRLLFGRSSLWSDCTSENSSVVRGMSHFRVEEKQNERLTIFSPKIHAIEHISCGEIT